MLGAEALSRRDTDADWRELGRSNPYWAVMSQPDFQRENMTPERVEAFYGTGGPYIAEVVRELAALTGSPPAGRALDFGCGVGRLAEAMTNHAGPVIGVDISPGMLEVARARGAKVTYAETVPPGRFDWINSFIVFQHIAPSRGEAILADLLSRLADGGVVSLQLTVWRDRDKQWPPAGAGLIGFLRAHRHRLWLESRPVGHIAMYDYDLSRVVRLLNLAGIEEMKLVSTDHGGHHGAIILGRKTRPATHDPVSH